MGNMTVEWIPTLGQVGTHMLCFDVTAQRPKQYCPDATGWGCGDAISSPSQCVNVEVFKDPAPNIWSSYAEDLDPYAHTHFAYIGRTLTFTVYADDDNCKDKPAITMGPMPPGASLAPQVEHVAAKDHTVTSFLGVNDTSTTHCPTQSRVFSWKIPHTYGGYKGRHCFYATDQCGEEEHCSGGLDTSELCLDFQVAKCKYAVSLEQTIAEVASIFGTDWIQVFNLNDLATPDYLLFKNQVLNVGHKYVVGTGDSVLKIARRFGTTDTSINFLNYELGELHTTDISVGQELCIIPNSCFGDVQTIWDKNPKVDESLERWYSGVRSAYDALRKAKMEQLEAAGPVARRLLAAEGGNLPSADTVGREGAGGDTAAGDGVGGRWERLEGLMRDLEELVLGGGEMGR